MAQTTASLVERALQIVDVVGAGQTASAEDTELAVNALSALIAELSAREIVYVAFDPDDLTLEDIPDELFNPLADVLAADLQTTFAGGRVAEAEREGMINRIRRVASIGPSYEVMQAQYF